MTLVDVIYDGAALIVVGVCLGFVVWALKSPPGPWR